jgi:hypothetical protein
MATSPTKNFTSQLPPERPDPIVLIVPLVLKLIVYCWLIWFFIQAIDAFYEYMPGDAWPFMLNMFRMWTFLPIHEAGHLFFTPLGTTMMFLGGSILQILLPLLWSLLGFRKRWQTAPFALFWVGENMMDVSLYVRDAPTRYLPLLGGHASRHDWYNILVGWDAVKHSGTLADILFFFGALVCMVSIIAGISWAIMRYLHPPPPQTLSTD